VNRLVKPGVVLRIVFNSVSYPFTSWRDQGYRSLPMMTLALFIIQIIAGIRPVL
jgi:hypothetical protein